MNDKLQQQKIKIPYTIHYILPISNSVLKISHLSAKFIIYRIIVFWTRVQRSDPYSYPYPLPGVTRKFLVSATTGWKAARKFAADPALGPDQIGAQP